MATGEYNKKKEQGRGFAGLSSLVSDVDTTLPPDSKKTSPSSTGTASGTNRPAPTPSPSKPQPTLRQPYKPPRQPGSVSSGRKWWIGIALVIGVLWLIGQFNMNIPRPAPADSSPVHSTKTASHSAPTSPLQPPVAPHSATATDADLMNDGEGATYRVPSSRVAELDTIKRAARSAQQEARDLDAQVERQKIPLDDEKRQVAQTEKRLEALGSEIELERSLVDSSNQSEVDSFNSKVREYNKNKAKVRRRINSFNTFVKTYNDLVQRARAQAQLANQMVDVYNSKLGQYGTRQ